MRPPDDVKRDLVRQWLGKADEDFRVAEHLASGAAAYSGATCFHAQQAVEKYLKAFLVEHQIEFSKTHDLGELLDLASSADPSLEKSLREVTALNPYSVDTRYPGDFPETTSKDARKAVELARRARETLVNLLAG